MRILVNVNDARKKLAWKKNGENMKGEQNFKKSNEIINKILKK